MKPNMQEQIGENHKLSKRQHRGLGRKSVDREKFADMSTSAMNRPSGHAPGKEVYKTAATKKRVGVMIRARKDGTVPR